MAGKIHDGGVAAKCLQEGSDFVLPGRAAILHYDLPQKIQADEAFTPVSIPVTREYLRSQGLGDDFVEYMKRWKGFVEG